jgi:carboxyl-terminal processing protease
MVRSKAPETLKEEDLLSESLEGMLQKLDPHSSYYTPEMYKDLMEDQEGKFFGLGMMVTKPTADSPLLVVLPLEGTPASRAGLRAGDLILEIDGLATAKMTNREAVRKLKGPEGTPVTLKVGRGGEDQDLMTLKRAAIPKHSVPYSYVIGDGIGYLKVNVFGQTTVEEMEDHIKDLTSKGMEGLVLDLRDNPGGALQAAVGVSSLFLKRSQDVVSIRGRNRDAQIIHRVPRDGKYKDLPLVVLVNQSSASASEIVSGALQDHGRATIVGERTWGKGLVQTVTPLENKGAAALTTARYFTPSGRQIQRDFTKSYDEYLFPELNQNAEESAGEGIPVPAGERRLSVTGGILPDVEVRAEKIPPLALRLERRRAFLDFAAKEIEAKRLEADKLLDPQVLVVKFKAFVAEKQETYTDAEWQESLKYMTQALQREALTMLEGQAAGTRAMIPLDPQLAKARTLVEERLADRGLKKAA